MICEFSHCIITSVSLKSARLYIVDSHTDVQKAFMNNYLLTGNGLFGMTGLYPDTAILLQFLYHVEEKSFIFLETSATKNKRKVQKAFIKLLTGIDIIRYCVNYYLFLNIGVFCQKYGGM